LKVIPLSERGSEPKPAKLKNTTLLSFFDNWFLVFRVRIIEGEGTVETSPLWNIILRFWGAACTAKDMPAHSTMMLSLEESKDDEAALAGGGFVIRHTHNHRLGDH